MYLLQKNLSCSMEVKIWTIRSNSNHFPQEPVEDKG